MLGSSSGSSSPGRQAAKSAPAVTGHDTLSKTVPYAPTVAGYDALSKTVPYALSTAAPPQAKPAPAVAVYDTVLDNPVSYAPAQAPTGRSTWQRLDGDLNSPGVPTELPRRNPASSSTALFLPSSQEADGMVGMQPAQREAQEIISLGSSPADKDVHLTVVACGQAVQLEVQLGGLSFADIHSQLQSALDLEGSIFQFFSVHGLPICTDQEIRDVVNRGEIPLTACLTDTQVSHLEMQQEELVQMQWKFMREQSTVISQSAVEVSNQVQDIAQALDMERGEQKATEERLRCDLEGIARGIANGVRESCKFDLMQLAERVNAVSQLLAKERSTHRAAIQGLELKVQNVRDSLEDERSWMRQELLLATNSIQQDTRCVMDAESHARQALEDRYSLEIRKLNERIEEFRSTLAKEAQERGQAYNKAALEADQALQATRQLSNARANIEAYVSNSVARQQELEDRCIALEDKIDRQLFKFDQLSEHWCNNGNEKTPADNSSEKEARKPLPTLHGEDDLVKRVAALETLAKSLEAGDLASAMCKYFGQEQAFLPSGQELRCVSSVEGRSPPEKPVTDRGHIADMESKQLQGMEPTEETSRLLALAASPRNMQPISNPLQPNRIVSVMQPVPVMRPSTSTPPASCDVAMIRHSVHACTRLGAPQDDSCRPC